MSDMQDLIAVLTAQHEAQMSEQQKAHADQMKEQRQAHAAQLDVLMRAQSEQAKAHREAQSEQAKAHREAQEKAIKTLVDRLPGRAASAASVPKFEAFDPAAELWKDYRVRFDIFAGANSIPDGKWAQVFLTSQAAPIFKLLDTLAGQQHPPVAVDNLDRTQILAFMEKRFDPKRFVIQERYKFYSSKTRQPGESLGELAARLRQAAATCDFPSVKDPLDDALRTAFTCRVNNEAVLKAFFKKKSDQLSFDDAVALGIEIEEAAKAAKLTTYGEGASDSSMPVYKVNPAKSKAGSSPVTKRACFRCGKTGHMANECRFRTAQCNYCKKKGHLESVCFKKDREKRKKGKVGLITATQSVQRIVPWNDSARVTLNMNGKTFEFEVDSGARDNFCSERTWMKLGKPPLQTSPGKYVAATGSPVPVLGTFCARVSVEGSDVRKDIPFTVSSLPRMDLLGRSAIWNLRIDILALIDESSDGIPIQQEVHAVTKQDLPGRELGEACRELCKEFPDLFKKELGCLRDFELEVKFKPDATPVFHKPRMVPYALLDDLNAAYEAGIQRGVWIPTSFNEYGTPVVPIRKPLLPGQERAKLRVCGDYSVTVNSQLETHRHPMPRPEDLMQKLGGGYGFTKIDLSEAYNQVKLAPESQRRLALSTHRGILLQARLPFGISSAPGYFQSIMEQLTSDLQGVAVYIDDLLVSGEDAQGHLRNLRALLQRLQDKGLRCNLQKCVFAQSSVEYLGHTLSSKGVSKGAKVDAVTRMPPPTNTSMLRSFLGSVQFYGKFIPDLATLAEPLNRLLRRDTPWTWGAREQQAFEALKDELGKEHVLAHFDPTIPVGMACDASNVGIGAVLFHRYPDGSERPISNVSKTLNDTQRRYSQVHKEALAVIFGLKKFHQFLYGRKFILVTDHKPLLALFGPTTGTPAMAANRLARWALMLSQYDYSIEYRKSSEHGNADALSRLPAGEDPLFDEGEEGEGSMVLTIRLVDRQLDPDRRLNADGDPLQPGVLARESAKDRVISNVMRYVREGWPHTIDSEEVLHYKRLADSLVVENGCLLFGARIVIPASLRSKVLQLIHLGHFGVQRMKQLARSVVYWLPINEEIEQLCRTCTSCAEHQNKPPKSVNHPWMLPEKPWSRLHMDHAVEFMGRNWLVLVDPFSKYPCIHPTGSITTQATIDLLEEDFAHFGYPHALVTDNATSFTSREFKTWCQSRGITHLTGAPYHPATNGTAERMVQSLKKSLKKSSLPPKKALQEFLMQYRRTPLAFGLSPSELLNGRRIRTRLDALLPSPAHVAQGKQAAEATKAQQRENTHSVADPVVNVVYPLGTPCYAQYFGPRRNRKPRWVPAVVTKVWGTRSVNVRVVPRGPTWRRHIEQLRPRYGVEEDADPGEVPESFQTEDVTVSVGPRRRPRRRNPRWPTDSQYGIDNPRRSERIQQQTAGTS